MTANQIIIPITLLLFVIGLCVLIVQSRRHARAAAQREHRPKTPEGGRDHGAIARSAMQGHATGGSQP